MSEEKINKKIESPIIDFSKNHETPNESKEIVEKSDTSLNISKNIENEGLIVSEKISENKHSGSSVLVQSSIEKRSKQVESILEVNLSDVFKRLTPEEQQEFKKKGEETSELINSLLDNAKVKTKKILLLIKEWLRMIPGVNKFFIEQLAKSKLDEIMKLKNK